MHMSFKSVCNKEQKGVICNMTTLSNSSQSTRPTDQNGHFVGPDLGQNCLQRLSLEDTSRQRVDKLVDTL